MANIIDGFSFKSQTIEGNLAKTYVWTYDNNTILIYRISLTKTKHEGFRVLREYKGMYLIEEAMAFKMDSFFNIANEVDLLLTELIRRFKALTEQEKPAKESEPAKEKYGWHTQCGHDDEPSGWLIEGGEEAYNEAMDKWQKSQLKPAKEEREWNEQEEDCDQEPCPTCGDIDGMVNPCCAGYDPLHYKNCGYG